MEIRKRPWYLRLDDWQHDHGGNGPGWGSMLWTILWRPVCALAERHYMKGT